MYQDNHRKFVVLMNQKQPLGRLINAVTHIALGLSATPATSPEQMDFLPYQNREHDLNASVSRFPVIVLKAKNGNQLRTVRQAAQAAGIPCNVFVHTMLGTSAEDQLQKTKNAHEMELDYLALILFGASADLDPFTRKFSLFGDSI